MPKSWQLTRELVSVSSSTMPCASKIRQYWSTNGRLARRENFSQKCAFLSNLEIANSCRSRRFKSCVTVTILLLSRRSAQRCELAIGPRLEQLATDLPLRSICQRFTCLFASLGDRSLRQMVEYSLKSQNACVPTSEVGHARFAALKD